MFDAFLDTHPFREMIGGMPVCPFPSMDDRSAWEAVTKEDREDLLALYESVKDTPYPMCRATQFMAFVTTGSRKAYEEPYFLRRRKLIASLMHMCLTGTTQALDDVIDGIWCICEESSWVISAHNVNQHPGTLQAKDKPLPEINDPYIDLFAAQTAMILAHVSAMAGSALDATAPVVRRRIRQEIERRILTPFLVRDDFWWMGFIRKDLCNWTPWIVSNIFFTASLQMTDMLLYAQLLDRGCRMLDRWLDVIPEDGGCDEGTGYYNMAGGALLDCLELLECVTGGKMTFWHVEKIRRILSFPLATQLPNGWFVNFADCDARPFLCGERLQLAGWKLCMPALSALGREHLGTPSRQIADVPHMTRMLARLFSSGSEVKQMESIRRDVWLENLQLRVTEANGMILCAKGGHNGESHNHNDVGSFILFAEDEPQIVDAGNMTYTSKTFAEERYTLFNTRSAYHNVPVIGGCEQKSGTVYAARDVRCLEHGLALDMAGAYGMDACASACLRSMELTDEGFVLTDEIILKECKAAAWVFLFRKRPEPSAGGIVSGLVRMEYDPDLSLKIEEIVMTDPRMARNYPGSLWRVMLEAKPDICHKRVFTVKGENGHE